MKHGFGVLAFLLAGLGAGGVQAAVPVDVVSCPAEGMSGPAPAPATPPRTPALIPAGDAEHLALYVAPGLEVLAPRGWHCLEMYGSGGAVLLVTPRTTAAGAFQTPTRCPARRWNCRC